MKQDDLRQVLVAPLSRVQPLLQAPPSVSYLAMICLGYLDISKTLLMGLLTNGISFYKISQYMLKESEFLAVIQVILGC